MNPPPLSSIRRIKRFAPVQLGKILGLLYAVVGLLFAPFFLLISTLGAKASGQPLSGFAAVGGFAVLAFPVIYGVAGFIFGAIGAVVYNALAGWIGGIEVEVE